MNRLFDAQSNYVRAYEHAVSVGSGTVPESLIDLGQKIHEAIGKFGTGPCLRPLAVRQRLIARAIVLR
jgi:hypothetical protein